MKFAFTEKIRASSSPLPPVKNRVWAVISLLLFATAFVFVSLPPAHAEPSIGPTSIPFADLDIGESEDDEGSFHAPLFALATFLGLVAAVTGIGNSSFKKLRSLAPLGLPRMLHRYASVACWSLFAVTFILWTFAYYSDRGKIFHTIHGVMGLITMALATTSVLTGIGMFRNVKRWRLAHLISSNMAFLFLILTDLTGAVLGD